MPPKVKIGLDFIEKAWPKNLKDARIGLLVHPASISSRFEHSIEVCRKTRRFILASLFGPQHGIRGETQDNMVEWEGFRDQVTGLTVHSLYGIVRQPHPSMLSDIDVMVVDMQDVGARYYTFIWTLALVMEACLKLNKAVVVLDRPNPIGGSCIEGPVLRQEFRSFVGLHKLPIRHGMTIGEISIYLKETQYPALDLHILQMKGWERKMWFDETGLPWVLPSPNMPTLDTAIVYPGMCLIEGTNLSEGRGTTRPFEIFGAPFIDPYKLIKRLALYKLPGTVFRPLFFQPTFHKYADTVCGGAQIHVTERGTYRPFKTAVAVMKAIHDLYPADFIWKNPPYEYEDRLQPIDILAGNARLREEIENGTDLHSMELWWNSECRKFDQQFRSKYLLYQ